MPDGIRPTGGTVRLGELGFYTSAAAAGVIIIVGAMRPEKVGQLIKSTVLNELLFFKHPPIGRLGHMSGRFCACFIPDFLIPHCSKYYVCSD